MDQPLVFPVEMLQMSSCLNQSVRGKSCIFYRWSMLPEDLQVEVLCRVPDPDKKCDKQLIRLKCVSRSWYSLISNRCVPRTYSGWFYGILYLCKGDWTRFQFTQNGGFHGPDDGLVETLIWKLQQHLNAIVPFRCVPEDLQDCCNGIMLFLRSTLSKPDQYYICNPTTRECVVIPQNLDHVNTKDSSYIGACVLFDPTSCVDSPNSFMIVVSMKKLQDYLHLDIYSSSFGNWSSHIVSLDPSLHGFGFVARCIYLNGVLYMLSLAKYLVSIRVVQDSTSTRIASCTAIELPGREEFSHCGCFGTSRGSLYYLNSNYSEIFVWVLQNSVRWSLQHIIDIDDLLKLPYYDILFGDFRSQIKVYGFSPYTEEIFVATPHRIEGYNPRTKKLVVYSMLCEEVSIICGEHKVFPLIQSVVSLNTCIKKPE